MSFNFLECRREQAFLLPPDIREWLPESDLAFLILDLADSSQRRPRRGAVLLPRHPRTTIAVGADLQRDPVPRRETSEAPHEFATRTSGCIEQSRGRRGRHGSGSGIP
jgi:hypothetical protein